MKYEVKIIETTRITHNVVRLKIAKPSGFTYTLGQAIELTLKTPNFKKQFAPFTLVSNPKDRHLSLIIKIYPEHHGLTEGISKANTTDSLIITEAWDSYQYMGEGVFIAAGSGITPFIPMFRELNKKNGLKNHRLIYANRRSTDIILKDELTQLFKSEFFNILSKQQTSTYDYGRIDFAYLKSRIKEPNQQFYLCGPESFMNSVKKDLIKYGVKQTNIQTGN
ncbi:flavodoxin reductase [Arenibacter aquaticus]|uniref:Flavodoxin reductase n=1 Tax=Arenibacter aquaticus TaxID=2489054 RepID=A0A430K4E7_9FLAO|nr:flavodoxin reductase [Arenibacter aquaticus]RTE53858.1 flavodoxin reductase [Arenibacter aquaticus]